MSNARMTGLVLGVALLAAPALAQTDAGGTGSAAPGGAAGTAPAIGSTTPATPPPAGQSGTTAPAAASAPSANPVLTENVDVRASKVIGAAVYNDKQQKLGSVDDLLLGKDHKVEQAVIAIGGVLGIGAKLVTVPYDKLQFPDQVSGSASRVMMPGATEASLKDMPEYHYAAK